MALGRSATDQIYRQVISRAHAEEWKAYPGRLVEPLLSPLGQCNTAMGTPRVPGAWARGTLGTTPKPKQPTDNSRQEWHLVQRRAAGSSHWEARIHSAVEREAEPCPRSCGAHSAVEREAEPCPRSCGARSGRVPRSKPSTERAAEPCPRSYGCRNGTARVPGIKPSVKRAAGRRERHGRSAEEQTLGERGGEAPHRSLMDLMDTHFAI